MGWFNKSYIITLLLVLTQNFSTNLANDAISKHEALSKVLTSFLKVPWIDLNSSWTDGVASTCRNDIVTLFESADAGEMWALQMLDAASKIPAGVLIGNIWNPGMFDECIAVKSHNNPANIGGRHCMISLSIPTKFFGDTSTMIRIQKLPLYNPSANNDLSLSISACVPSSCGAQDIKGLVNATIGNTPKLAEFEVGVAKVSCSSSGSRNEQTLGSILTFSFFAVLATTLLFCTVCDIILRARSDDGPRALRKAASFSIYTSVLQIFSPELSSDTMPALHGLRVLNLFVIMIGHRALTLLLHLTANTLHLHELTQTPLSSMIFTIPFAVDTSFVMSGFFTSCLFLKALRSGAKFNMLTIYIYRYMRLTPCIVVLLLFVIFILPHFGSGPNWDLVSAKTITLCEKNWWTNMLYIQNLVNVDEICLLHTWYVAVEMQLLWFSPIVLYPLFYRPKLGLVLLGLFLTVSFVTPAAQLAINRWSAFFAMAQDTPEIFSQFLNSYPATYNRALPYLIGILLGYDASKRRREISKVLVTLYWVVAVLFVILCGLSADNIQPNANGYNMVYEMIYPSVARFLWSIAMAWVIYACTHGYGGPIAKFLSLPAFVPLSRMCYSIYLVHFVLQMAVTAAERTPQYTTTFTLMYTFFGDVVVSLIGALVLCSFVETPILRLSRLLRSRASSPSTEHDSTAKQARFSMLLKKYLKQSTDRVNYNFITETITSRQDFWQTISDELNTLVEGPSKSPAEWSKTWQVWQSGLSKMDSICGTQSKGIRNEGFEPESGLVALENEFMVFLAAVNCRLTDDPSSKNSGYLGPESQSDIRNWQRQDSIRLGIPNLNSFDDKEKQNLEISVSRC